MGSTSVSVEAQPAPAHSSPRSPTEASTDNYVIDESVLAEEKKMQDAAARAESSQRKSEQQSWSKAGGAQQKGQFNKLMHLVEQSKVFATIMQQRMQQEEAKYEQRSAVEKKKLESKGAKAEAVAAQAQRKSTRGKQQDVDSEDELSSTPTKRELEEPVSKRGLGKAGKRQNEGAAGGLRGWLKKESSNIEAKAGGNTVAEALAEASKDDGVGTSAIGRQDLRPADQPRAVTGGIMRNYQLEGLAWLRSLYENGLNGILADEMGLGKTIQTISFLAFLREMQSYGPFLIVAPLSTLGNWIDEFARFTPSIKTVLYHGSPDQRAEIRSKQLKRPGTEDFPVVCTSYEICMNDRKFLSHYGWKFIIIDEGHRLKNLNCRLIKELKQYQSANRLLITGTPLQNNLAELWSLLNFLMPEVFDTLDNFESFFDFSAVLQKGGHKSIIEEDQKNNLVASLHAILKPFLLRRVKTDVEDQLPPKREYVIYAPLTSEQKELYRAILEGNGREHLQKTAVDKITEKLGAAGTSSRSSSRKRKTNDGLMTPVSTKSLKSSRESTPSSVKSTRGARNKKVSYKEVSDREYFKQAEQTPSESEDESEHEAQDSQEIERVRTIDIAKREVATKKMQNPLMQLRLTCNSPHNFYWPFSESSPPDQSLVTASGKMLILDQLVPHLIKRDHKILIFSQFKTQLDLLEDWCELRDWEYCRIDGGVAWSDRGPMIKRFNGDKNVRIFLLSTRAGGQGINLAAADTVILFDSDWNPQQDLQAQDRAHRIGQTRPVIVYRIATKNTVEQTLLEKAEGKRRLEKLVIAKGKFKSVKSGWTGTGQGDDYAELMKALDHDEFEGYEMDGEGVLSKKDLERLTDRSEAAYDRAQRGEDEGDKFRVVETRKDHGVLASVTRRSKT